jgi:hypothetical protein
MEKLVLQWLIWVLFFSLILGGIPWRIPSSGRHFLQTGERKF